MIGLTLIPPAEAWNPFSTAGKALQKRFVGKSATLIKRPVTAPKVSATAVAALPEQVRNTFSGKITRRILSNDTTFYRYHSSYNAIPNQRNYVYLTKNPGLRGPAARDQLALPAADPPTHLTTYVLPKGTVVDEGIVAPAFGLRGGGLQAVVRELDHKWARHTLELPR